jgi:hypothetical protein
MYDFTDWQVLEFAVPSFRKSIGKTKMHWVSSQLKLWFPSPTVTYCQIDNVDSFLKGP